VVALRKGEGGADRILAVGKEAKKMLGRTPEKVEAIAYSGWSDSGF